MSRVQASRESYAGSSQWPYAGHRKFDFGQRHVVLEFGELCDGIEMGDLEVGVRSISSLESAFW